MIKSLKVKSMIDQTRLKGSEDYNRDFFLGKIFALKYLKKQLKDYPELREELYFHIHEKFWPVNSTTRF